MDSSAKGIPTLVADNLSRKCVALLVFGISLINTFFCSTLFNQGGSCFKVLMANNCFMVVGHIILVQNTIIGMAIKVVVGVGLLEDAISSVFLVCDNASDGCRRPVIAFACRDMLSIKFFCDSVSTFATKQGRKDALHNLGFFRDDF